jgi:hypothetical protein
MLKFVKFLDRLEDKIRQGLSLVPIFYALLGAISIVLFWRGIWDLADLLHRQYDGTFIGFIFDPAVSLLISILVLLGTGLFVSFFIGDRIIMSGLKHEKKVEEKTESEVREEEEILEVILRKVDHLTKEVEDLKANINKK